MPYKCPLCVSMIDSLNYREDGIIYGTYYVENDEHEQDNSEATGENLIYTCPECDREVSIEDCEECDENGNVLTEEQTTERERTGGERLESIYNSILNPYQTRTPPNTDNQSITQNLERDNIDQSRQIPTPPAINSEWSARYSGCRNSHEKPTNPRILICKCKTKNEAIYTDETVECINCHKELNDNNSIKIISLTTNLF